MSNETSLIEAMVRYLDDCTLNEQSPRTIENKQYEMRSFLRWHIVHHGALLRQLSKDSIDDYKRYLLIYRNPQTNKGIDKATRRNKVMAVKTFCKTMFDLEYLLHNPALKVRIPKAQTKIMKSILQKDEVAAIFAQTHLHDLKGTRDRAMLAVFHACGLRRNEITKLTMSSVNCEAGVIFIEQGKGAKDRIVPIAADAIDIIQYYIETVRPTLLSFGSGNFLFIDNKGNPYKGGQVTAMITRYKRRAGVAKPGASNLYRHTTATTMLDNGADIRVIQAVLGHKNLATTQIYTHVAVRKLCNDYNKYHPAALERVSYR